MSALEKYIQIIPDFPKKGIVFRDILPLFKNHLNDLVDEMAQKFTPEELEKFDFIAGIEARGFMVGAALAVKLNKGFIPIRKEGKLPPDFAQVPYQLEYGTDMLEMQFGSGNVLLVDDVLATGGTLQAAIDICEKTGHHVADVMCIVNLAALNNFTFNNRGIKCLFTF